MGLWVLQTVGRYQLELTTLPYQTRIPHTIKCSAKAMAQITKKVAEVLFKGAIVEIQVTREFCLPTVPCGDKRWELEASRVNQYVKTKYFKMEGLHLLPDFLQSQDWMLKMDLKDAYHSLRPSTPQWEGKTYKFRCLLIGQLETVEMESRNGKWKTEMVKFWYTCILG